MTTIKNFFAKLLIVAALVTGICMPEQAQAKPGGGKIGGGIALIVTGSVLGGLMVMSWGMGICGGENTNYEKCSANLVLGGAASIGIGLGVGIPLVVSGARERKAYKRSLADTSPQEGWSLNMTVVNRKPAIGFNLGI